MLNHKKIITVAAMSMLILTGCAAEEATEPASDTTSSPSASASPTETETPTATPTPEESAQPSEAPAETPEATTLPETPKPAEEATEPPEIGGYPDPVDAQEKVPAPGPEDQGAPVLSGAKLIAGGEASAVTIVSGTGTVPITFTRDPGSTAPNLPTYVSASCDGQSTYSGAFNTTGSGSVTKDISFSGNTCTINVKVAQPSPKWEGTYSAVYAAPGAPQHTSTGVSSVVGAGWVSSAVTGSRDYTLSTPAGFKGAVDIKLTACSSEGGTSDATATKACGEFVQKGVGSSATVVLSDSSGTLGSQNISITPEKHHDMLSFSLPRATTGPIIITVHQSSGSAMLVHGPGTRAVGTV